MTLAGVVSEQRDISRGRPQDSRDERAGAQLSPARAAYAAARVLSSEIASPPRGSPWSLRRRFTGTANAVARSRGKTRQCMQKIRSHRPPRAAAVAPGRAANTRESFRPRAPRKRITKAAPLQAPAAQGWESPNHRKAPRRASSTATTTTSTSCARPATLRGWLHYKWTRPRKIPMNNLSCRRRDPSSA